MLVSLRVETRDARTLNDVRWTFWGVPWAERSIGADKLMNIIGRTRRARSRGSPEAFAGGKQRSANQVASKCKNKSSIWPIRVDRRRGLRHRRPQSVIGQLVLRLGERGVFGEALSPDRSLASSLRATGRERDHRPDGAGWRRGQRLGRLVQRRLFQTRGGRGSLRRPVLGRSSER